MDQSHHRSKLDTVFPDSFRFEDSLSPIVRVEQNFDQILIPREHPSRRLIIIKGRKSDTFYISEELILRTQTSAHQIELLAQGAKSFCVLGDVYRKDEIDATHYPAFHQMEALRLYKVSDLREYASEALRKSYVDRNASVIEDIQDKNYQYFEVPAKNSIEEKQNSFIRRLVIDDLKETHENLMRYLFPQQSDMRWNADKFPFTEPSYEMEVLLKGKWLEVLGSGIVHKGVLRNAGVDPNKYIGWASGVGLERLAMIMYNIPDIRLFWSSDPRFLSQFQQDSISEFKPFSKYPSCFKDVSFYIPRESIIHDNDVYEIVRNYAGDLVEKMELVDSFENQSSGKVSKCFRINYRSLERTLTNSEIDSIQLKIRAELQTKLQVELR